MPVSKFKSGSDFVDVPLAYQPQMPMQYPPDNAVDFESYFKFRFMRDEKILLNRTYLPVMWTAYYVKNRFGKDRRAIANLQQVIRKLPKNKKYFTIVQYDDGILNDLRGLDIIVFAMSGNKIDYALPLICQPHEFEFENERTITASFCGKMTHPIRDELMARYRYHRGYYMSNGSLNLRDYCRMLSMSVFSFCPRGYGATSFRIMESLQYGAIPIYISDDFIVPHKKDFGDYGILVKAGDIEKLDLMIKAFTPGQIESLQKAGKQAFEEIYTYEANYTFICEKLS